MLGPAVFAMDGVELERSSVAEGLGMVLLLLLGTDSVLVTGGDGSGTAGTAGTGVMALSASDADEPPTGLMSGTSCKTVNRPIFFLTTSPTTVPRAILTMGVPPAVSTVVSSLGCIKSSGSAVARGEDPCRLCCLGETRGLHSPGWPFFASCPVSSTDIFDAISGIVVPFVMPASSGISLVMAKVTTTRGESRSPVFQIGCHSRYTERHVDS